MAITTKLKEDKEPTTSSVCTKYTIYQTAIYNRQLDNLILVNFFLFFVVSFIAGILFLYSSLSLWTFQVCEDGDLYHVITDQQKENVVNTITYNASAPLSLKT